MSLAAVEDEALTLTSSFTALARRASSMLLMVTAANATPAVSATACLKFRVFFLPPRTGVGLLRPDKRCWLCGGVPHVSSSFCTQFVNVGRGSRRGQIRGRSLVCLERRPCARNILHIERAREWELAQAACRLVFSPYGQPRGCYAARPESTGASLALLKVTRVNGDVTRLAAARIRHKEGREELGKGAEDI
jgi:hypothetical protein